jgi:hypothetical protein
MYEVQVKVFAHIFTTIFKPLVCNRYNLLRCLQMLHVCIIIPIPLYRLLTADHKFVKLLTVYLSPIEVQNIVLLQLVVVLLCIYWIYKLLADFCCCFRYPFVGFHVFCLIMYFFHFLHRWFLCRWSSLQVSSFELIH